MNRKLKIGFISNCPVGGKTGLSRNMRALLPILYKMDKYEIFFLAQGMPDNDSNFLKLPWKNFGVFKNFDQIRFQQDPNYQRLVAYGNTSVEDFVVSNKLDVIFAVDDEWAFDPNFYLNTDWYNHIKDNFINWVTADSEPILPLIKEWTQKCKNTWFWSSFAERLLKIENKDLYSHCQTMHGSIDSNDFKPLSPEERLQLRHKFNIKDDEKVIIYLGRNQLRKLFYAHMEALKIWKDKNPDKKIKLLFHTGWGNEPMGWPLERIRDELKLSKEDVLCTYFCKNCNDWNIQGFEGEDKDCPHCSGKGTKITANVSSSINEKDLNKIYNVADASCSIFTSGGQEYTNVESLLAGLPLACVNYSCGEDFCNNSFVYTIKGTHTRECNSSFKKFVPDINSVVDFYEYIYNLDKDKKRKIVYEGRKWAIEQFDGNNIANKIQQFLDTCKPIDWELFLNKKKELKNINAQIEDKADDDAFVVECYKKILNMEPSPEDEGRRHWNNFLKQPKDKGQLKNEMVNCMRQAGFVHNQKVQPNSLENLLDKQDKFRVLLVLKESLGDNYILTSLLPEIKNKYPESSIYIATDPKYWEVFDMNENIKSCIPYTNEMENEMQMVGFGEHKGLFNHYIHVGIGTQRLLNYLSNKYE
jgi:glycosyltransferase involved in cell wall biosynthesis